MKMTTAKKVSNAPKVRYEPNKGEKFLLEWAKILAEGNMFANKLKNPSVALRGKAGEYSVAGTLTELIRASDYDVYTWNTTDPLFKTYTIDGYAFEIPMWCINSLTQMGLTNTEIIKLLDLCYDIDQDPTPRPTFDMASQMIETLVRNWIKEKSAELSITDAEWDEIYLVCGNVVDLTKGKLLASDWKKIAAALRSHTVETTMGSWRGYVGRLAKKIGVTGEKAALRYKEIPAKSLVRFSRMGALPVAQAAAAPKKEPKIAPERPVPTANARRVQAFRF